VVYVLINGRRTGISDRLSLMAVIELDVANVPAGDIASVKYAERDGTWMSDGTLDDEASNIENHLCTGRSLCAS
jgi:hypothetical protein